MNKQTKYLFWIFLILLVFVLPMGFDDLFAQCAMCRKNAESSMNEANSIAKGLNKGILYMMAIPYLALAFIFREQIKGLYKSLRAKSVSKN